MEGDLATAVALPGFGSGLAVGRRPEPAESDARSEVDAVAPPGAPDVGDTPGGAGSFPADDEPVRASRRTYAPRVTAPGDGCQAANEPLAGAGAAIVSERVGRSGGGKRCCVRSSQLRGIRSTEGGEPSGSLGSITSENRGGPGKRDVR